MIVECFKRLTYGHISHPGNYDLGHNYQVWDDVVLWCQVSSPIPNCNSAPIQCEGVRCFRAMEPTSQTTCNSTMLK